MDVSLALAALEFYVRRPTIAALIMFGDDLSHANTQAGREVGEVHAWGVLCCPWRCRVSASFCSWSKIQHAGAMWFDPCHGGHARSLQHSR